jgi:hypothetical protein
MRERSPPVSCSRKIAFASKGRAKRILRAMKVQGELGQDPGWKALQIYRCDCCGNWHVGHDPAWLRRHRLNRPLPTLRNLGIVA